MAEYMQSAPLFGFVFWAGLGHMVIDERPFLPTAVELKPYLCPDSYKHCKRNSCICELWISFIILMICLFVWFWSTLLKSSLDTWVYSAALWCQNTVECLQALVSLNSLQGRKKTDAPALLCRTDQQFLKFIVLAFVPPFLFSRDLQYLSGTLVLMQLFSYSDLRIWNLALPFHLDK